MNINALKMKLENHNRKNRDQSIDLLRFIALTGIIIVHIHPSAFWIQLRNFDVPLLVFLSGVS